MAAIYKTEQKLVTLHFVFRPLLLRVYIKLFFIFVRLWERSQPLDLFIAAKLRWGSPTNDKKMPALRIQWVLRNLMSEKHDF